jgi:hypothetical protein
VESNWVHLALRPLIGLLCQPRVIMTMEMVERLAGETEVLGKTCSNATLSTTNPTWCPVANPGRRGGKPATNPLSYGTANPYTLQYGVTANPGRRTTYSAGHKHKNTQNFTFNDNRILNNFEFRIVLKLQTFLLLSDGCMDYMVLY